MKACRPAAKYDAAPARALRDDSDSDWLSRKDTAKDTPETRLAKAKLMVMLRNLAGSGREAGNNKDYLRHDAHNWFFGNGDFQWWCEIAGFEPDYVREKARKVYENGLPESSMMRKRLPPMTPEEKRLYRNAYFRERNARKRRERTINA